MRMRKKLRKRGCWLILADASMLLGKISRAELSKIVKMVVLVNEELYDRRH